MSFHALFCYVHQIRVFDGCWFSPNHFADALQDKKQHISILNSNTKLAITEKLKWKISKAKVPSVVT